MKRKNMALFYIAGVLNRPKFEFRHKNVVLYERQAEYSRGLECKEIYTIIDAPSKPFVRLCQKRKNLARECRVSISEIHQRSRDIWNNICHCATSFSKKKGEKPANSIWIFWSHVHVSETHKFLHSLITDSVVMMRDTAAVLFRRPIYTFKTLYTINFFL